MTVNKLRVLLVETSFEDAQRTLAKLEQSGYKVEHLLVDNKSDMQAALIENDWDVVLCSYDESGFCGLDALKLMQSKEVNIPFLFLSYHLHEETIIHTMQSGANDYIFKGSLNRLAPSIEHNLREARIRREHRQAQIALQENQARLQAFITNLPGMAYQVLLKHDGDISFPYISDGCKALLDLNPQNLKNNPHLFMQMLHPDDRISYEQTMRASANNLSFWNWEGRIVILPVGEIKWINLRCSPRKTSNGEIQWEGIMSNISQSKQAEIEIKHSQEQLRELSSHVQLVREQERLNIAREVHDDLGSTLTAIKLNIAWLGGRLTRAAPELIAKIKDVESLVDKCTAAAHDISHSLRPSTLDCFGIIAAMEIEVDEFEQRTGISCVFNHPDEDITLNPDIAIALFRILQESLTNIMKHAQAGLVKIDLYNQDSCVEMIVSDNGLGFTESDRIKPRSFGLRGIKERVAYFGGYVHIKGTPDSGTTIKACIPHHSESTTVGGFFLPQPQQKLL
ncbi:hybrid sensor histidine kinase/response regulator [Candidatus Nitrotoga sp. M5]|uniref:hybrid sensor histidine kinase/response regulator n=1 Tax=Candidatus Nitrotoga sp. M5 TaxID=2890409 RepID=UPI001EF63228|nr:histidine kinase [Candidatus Nitrotoga sp. M5]CAH1388258.1 Histidine kinase-, DNA gyrase B-, and HSP90-like ATPase [Candidatus Nitrotoga sp. M5]